MVYFNLDRLIFMSLGLWMMNNCAAVTNAIVGSVLSNDGFGQLGFYSLGLAFAF
jgi:hypothetical protein